MKKYIFEYEDESNDSKISFEYDGVIEEKLKVEVKDDAAILYANRTALKLLSNTLIKLHESNYQAGFHVHINEDFDADLEEKLRIILIDE